MGRLVSQFLQSSQIKINESGISIPLYSKRVNTRGVFQKVSIKTGYPFSKNTAEIGKKQKTHTHDLTSRFSTPSIGGIKKNMHDKLFSQFFVIHFFRNPNK